jgi:hypothetical protein
MTPGGGVEIEALPSALLYFISFAILPSRQKESDKDCRVDLSWLPRAVFSPSLTLST